MDILRRSVTPAFAVLALAGCALPATPAATGVPAPATVAAGKTAAKAAAAPDSDQGWTMVGTPKLSLSMGLLTGHVRVRNDSDSSSATVQLTYDPDGSPVVLSGAANNVAKGRTVTVDVVSGDKVARLPKGRPEFRVTAAF